MAEEKKLKAQQEYMNLTEILSKYTAETEIDKMINHNDHFRKNYESLFRMESTKIVNNFHSDLSDALVNTIGNYKDGANLAETKIADHREKALDAMIAAMEKTVMKIDAKFYNDHIAGLKGQDKKDAILAHFKRTTGLDGQLDYQSMLDKSIQNGETFSQFINGLAELTPRNAQYVHMNRGGKIKSHIHEKIDHGDLLNYTKNFNGYKIKGEGALSIANKHSIVDLVTDMKNDSVNKTDMKKYDMSIDKDFYKQQK